MMFCLLINNILLSNITAKAQIFIDDNVFYYDGLPYNYTLDTDTGDFNIQCLSDDHSNTYLTLHADGTADVLINNKEDEESYFLDIQEMNEESLDIDVYAPNVLNSNIHDENNPNDNISIANNTEQRKDGLILVKEYHSYADLESDLNLGYIGQEFTGTFSVLSLSTLIYVLVVLVLTVVIGGLTYYSICNVIDIVKARSEAATKDNRPQAYYPASIQGPQVVIDYNNPISFSVAKERIKHHQDVYTYSKTAAEVLTRTAATELGISDIIDEIDKNMEVGYVYFRHFHISRNIKSHIFYGIPYTK